MYYAVTTAKARTRHINLGEGQGTACRAKATTPARGRQARLPLCRACRTNATYYFHVLTLDPQAAQQLARNLATARPALARMLTTATPVREDGKDAVRVNTDCYSALEILAEEEALTTPAPQATTGQQAKATTPRKATACTGCFTVPAASGECLC